MVIESGYIYAIGYEGCIKLGISATDVRGRLRTMQTGNAQPLELIAQTYVENYKLIEKILHREHRARWIRGEWYSLTLAEAREVIASVGEDLVKKDRERRVAESKRTLERIKDRGRGRGGERDENGVYCG